MKIKKEKLINIIREEIQNLVIDEGLLDRLSSAVGLSNPGVGSSKAMVKMEQFISKVDRTLRAILGEQVGLIDLKKIEDVYERVLKPKLADRGDRSIRSMLGELKVAVEQARSLARSSAKDFAAYQKDPKNKNKTYTLQFAQALLKYLETIGAYRE